MIKHEKITYVCDSNENIIKLSIVLTKGLWAVTTVNHIGQDLHCDPLKHNCGENTFRLPLTTLELGKAKDAIFFDSRINTTIAGSKNEKEVEVQVSIEGGKKKKTKSYLLKKTPGKSSKLRLTIEYLSILLVSLLTVNSYSQIAYEVDNMRAPANAAASLLGIEESDIKLIEHPTDFAALLQTDSKNFTGLASNFGFQLNPFGAFQKRERPADFYLSNEVRDNFLQTSLVSMAFKDIEDELLQSVGFQFSLTKGKVENKDEQINAIEQLYFQLDGINAIENQHQSVQNLKEERLILIGELRTLLDAGIVSDEEIEQRRTEIRELGDQIDLLQDEEFLSDTSVDFQVQADMLATQLFQAQENRTGLRVDFSSAFVLEFPDRRIGNSQVEQVAAWLTFSPNASSKKKDGTNKNHDWLGIIRYQRQPDLKVVSGLSEDASMLDFGGKYLYRWEKLRLGGEFIYRRFSELEFNEIDQNSSRYLLDVSYNVGKNNYLSISYGKDFDEQTIQNGNIIAAINFIKGFGSKKEVSQ